MVLDAGIWIAAPFCGLRPVRAERSRISKVPKPFTVTLPPASTVRVMNDRAASTMLFASVCAMPNRSAMLRTRSVLVA